jgi:glycosyltransferase involved in cell wall biosynthesis
VDEVIVVDGRSTDNTIEVARELLPEVVIVYQKGKGKGDALRAGFAAATGEIIVMLDADGSTDPGEIPHYVGALLAGADFAKGSRFIQGAGTSDMELLRRLGNWGFVTLVRILFGGNYTDLCYGYNAFWKSTLSSLSLDCDGFEVETVMNLRALYSGLKVMEVGSFEAERRFGTSNLNTFRDGWRVLKSIFKEYVRQHRSNKGTEMVSERRYDDAEAFAPAMQTLLNEALQFVLIGSENVSPEASQLALAAVRDSFSELVAESQRYEGGEAALRQAMADPQFVLRLSVDALTNHPVRASVASGY